MAPSVSTTQSLNAYLHFFYFPIEANPVWRLVLGSKFGFDVLAFIQDKPIRAVFYSILVTALLGKRYLLFLLFYKYQGLIRVQTLFLSSNCEVNGVWLFVRIYCGIMTFILYLYCSARKPITASAAKPKKAKEIFGNHVDIFLSTLSLFSN